MTQHQSDTQLIAGRYAIRSLIGRGGSGAVWRGEDLQLQRAVAIKRILLSDSCSTRSRTRAMREAQAVAKLQTPGVVQVYDVHDDGTQVSLIMELIDAPSLLRAVRRDGPCTPEDAAWIGRSLLRTLLAVHAAGVIHRDVKPSNVLVRAGEVHITDFGIALLGDDPTLTATGSVLGTPTYMAPEQARGERVGPTADLYGLGATLYFAVEGRAPFDAVGSVETTRAVRDQPHRPGMRLGPLGPLVDRLLAKNPDDRPGTDEIAAALAAITAVHDGAPPRSPAHGHGDAHGSTVDVTSPEARSPDPPAPPPVAPPTAPRPPGPAGSTHGHDGPTSAAEPAAVDLPLPPPPADDDGIQVRRVLLWGAVLLALLAAALLLLFVAVREHPGAAAQSAAALVLARPIMGDWSTQEQ